MSPAPKRCIVLLIDGISTSKFESFLNKGLLPNFQKLRKTGTYIPTSISSFPSVTGPAHIPIFTGKSPTFFGITGHNQFYRNFRYFDNYLRNYAGFNNQLSDSETIFDYYENSVAVGELVYKGATKAVRYDTAIWAWAFRNDCNTSQVLRRIKKEYQRGRDLIAAWFVNSDALQHMWPRGKALLKMLQKIDRFLGEFEKLKDGNTKIVICSDHGMERSFKFFRLKKAFRELGLLINKMKFNFDGGAFAQIYFKQAHQDRFSRRKISYKSFRHYVLNPTNFYTMMQRLAESPALEFIILKEKSQVYIFSAQGVATVRQKNKQYRYEILEGQDPFGYAKDSVAKKLLGKWFSEQSTLELSQHTEYPDAIYQVYHLLKVRNAGDLIVTSAPHISFNRITPNGVHGGLRREQIVSPFLSSEKIPHTPKYMRSTEIFKFIKP